MRSSSSLIQSCIFPFCLARGCEMAPHEPQVGSAQKYPRAPEDEKTPPTSLAAPHIPQAGASCFH